MDESSKDGTPMKIRPHKMMIITVIGMIIMIAVGRGDQRANEKEKLSEYLGEIEYRSNAENNVNKPESRSKRHATCMIEIEIGTTKRWEAAVN